MRQVFLAEGHFGVSFGVSPVKLVHWIYTYKHMPCLSAFVRSVSALAQGAPCSWTFQVRPEKVTSTCPQSFAELDPDCLSRRLLGAGKSFKGGAEACRLSLTWPRRLPPASQYVWTPSQGG